ncbi:Putative tRNA (guanine(37)-N1)-methyltransferase [Rhizopus microsporus]|nr:Putative tRNA (guanine(37)-N1)-methyltransferase [Rhizopus microsporus]
MFTLTPPLNRGMTVFNRDAFKKVLTVKAVKVPSKKVHLFTKTLSMSLFNQPRFRNVFSAPDDNDARLVLLRGDLEDIEDLSPTEQELIKNEALGIVSHEITLDYDYWNSEQILRSVIPEELEIPSSFTQIGHIAHLNLKEQYFPWKKIIGQVILDKNKYVKTVVNKTDQIDTTFRFFKMEILAGEDDMIAEVVYWNSRLHTEHERLIQLFKPKEYVCDVFAGVGPFAIPSAKKGSIVYANDLNPASFEWMKENIKINKLKSGIHPYNMDGREFIRQAVKDLQATSENEWKTFDHFVMNLPATAIEFLDAFRGAYYDYKHLFNANSKLPYIHCHCFTKSPDPNQDIIERVTKVLGETPDPVKTSLHYVRNVAPKKDMYCISFPLSDKVAFASPDEKRKMDDTNVESSVAQKRRTERADDN